MCLALLHILMDDGPLIQSNRLDSWILRTLRSKSPWHFGERRLFWRPVFQKMVLEFSDQQLLLGIAILLAGLWQSCTISVYNFTMVWNLAWVSSTVHINTLDVLREYLLGAPQLRNWRVGLMAVTFVLMVVYTVLPAHNFCYSSAPYPAECLFTDMIGNVSGIAAFRMSINLLQLLWGYRKGMFLLYGSVSSTVETWLVEKPLSVMERGAANLRQRKARAPKRRASKAFTLFHKPRAWALTVVEKILLVAKHAYCGLATLAYSRWANLAFSLGFFI